MNADPLALFDPLVRQWFAARVGTPTAVQAAAWPRIAAGEHVLVTAPTGSGKTLTAFLWALDRLLTGAWPGGAVRVLYVSPLKALGYDIERNLVRPLAELRAAAAAAGRALPPLEVRTRTGDTPSDERQRALRHPPEILITTPESLNVLLTSVRGRMLLSGLNAVILDEIHAVAGAKRGAHLITAVERLVPLAGEVQRIALSATVRPADRIAAWVGGHKSGTGTPFPNFVPRPVAVVAAGAPKRYELTVRFPAAETALAPAAAGADGLWAALVAAIRERIRANRSTLVFANSRRMVEKLARMINDGEPEPLAWAHHGSLAREVRRLVEQRLKEGSLRAVVATNSLELGIDIGDLDEVLQVQVPFSVASAVQRVGRAGHGVGQDSRAQFLPLVPVEIADAAVTVRALAEGDVEPIVPLTAPLDVLAQVIVSMVATAEWPIDELYALLAASAPYHALPRRHFDLVLGMLGGRWAGTRLRALEPLVTVDEVAGTVRGRRGAERRVYMSGGTIPDRGLFHLRHAASGALLGELDEEFVWERAVGDTFTLGVTGWRIEKITHNDVLVVPSRAASAMAPFWRGEPQDRGQRLAGRLAELLERLEPRLADPALPDELAREFRLDRAAAGTLIAELERQRDATRALPHRHRLVIEHAADPSGEPGAAWTILHTLWGGRANRAFALALAALAPRVLGHAISAEHDDRCVVLGLPRPDAARELLDALAPDAIEGLVRERLGGSGFFGARFREAAGCALLLPREGFKRRTPLWLSRQRAKELLDGVRGIPDFPLVLEAWRACLADELEVEAVVQRVAELQDGLIEVTECRTLEPSPFAATAAWKRTNELMYADDTPAGAAAAPNQGLLRELVHSTALRPRIAPELVEEFRRKLQRVAPGYAPRTAAELFDWLLERGAIPGDQWDELLAALRRDGPHPAELLASLRGRVTALRLPGRDRPRLVAAVQALPRLAAALELDPARLELLDPAGSGARDQAAAAALAGLAPRAVDDDDGAADPLVELVADLLRFAGPVDLAAPARWLGLYADRAQEIVETLADAARVVVDPLTDGATEAELCDADNLERLLRLQRARSRPAFAARPLAELPLFLAHWQGLGRESGTPDDLRAAFERLFGYAAPAALWETELLPARVPGYQPAWLDALLAETDLGWFGCGPERIAFALGEERDLFAGNATGAETGDDKDDAPAVTAKGDVPLDRVLPPGPGRFAFEELLARSGLLSPQLTAALWDLTWQGLVGNDGFAALRRGIETGFKPAAADPRPGLTLRRKLSFDRWKTSRPFGGAWFRLPAPLPPADPLEEDALLRERVRTLLDRYGIVFRELLARELPALSWGRLFRTLRLMELSGEVVTGPFFEGLPGLQFAAPAAFRRLADGLDDGLVWRVNAMDPAAPTGLGAGVFPGMPRRAATSWIVFHGTRPVIVAERGGKRLVIDVAPGDPLLAPCLAAFEAPLRRVVRPLHSITVETINGEPAPSSPYLADIAARFAVERDIGAVILRKR